MQEPGDSFIHARWKIERAKKHLWDFHHAAAAFVANNNHFISFRRDPESSKYTIFVGPSEKVPTELSLIVGDAIHNARAALDHVWMGVVRYLDPTTKAKRTFPIDEERDALERRLSGTEVCRAFPCVQSVILDKIKPYKTGNTDCWLFALNRLDNRDKHNMLVISRACINIRRARLVCPEVLPPPKFVLDVADVRVMADQPMPFAEWTMAVPQGVEPHFESDPEMSAFVAFDADVEGVGQMAVGPALTKLVQSADEAVGLFAECFQIPRS